MTGLATMRKQLYKRIQELVTEIKQRIFDCGYNEQDCKYIAEELSELKEKYDQCCDSLKIHHSKWKDVEQLAKIEAERPTVNTIVQTALEALKIYQEETIGTLKDIENSMEQLGLSTMFSDSQTTVMGAEVDVKRSEETTNEQEAEYIRAELEKLQQREKELYRTLQDMGTPKKEEPKQGGSKYDDFTFSDRTTADDPKRPYREDYFRPDYMSTPEQMQSMRSSSRVQFHEDEYRYTTQEKGMTSPQVGSMSDLRQTPPQVERGTTEKGYTLPQVEKGSKSPASILRPSVMEEQYRQERFLPSEYRARAADHNQTSANQEYSDYRANAMRYDFGYENVDFVGRHLTKIPLPKYDGSKVQFDGWWQAFLACVDSQPIKPEIKLLRLQECLEGDASSCLKGIGFSPTAYEVVKDRLQRKYGGERRKLTMTMEEVHNARIVRDGKPEDMEKFAELLDRLIVNLIDHGRQGELGPGMLYLQLKKKLSEEVLRRYERWLYEHRFTGDVPALREYANQEAEFQMTAAETIRGFSQEKGKRKKDEGDKKTSRTLYGDSGNKDRRSGKRPLVCHFCKKEHGLWQCTTFKQMPHHLREKKIKELQLCERCLSMQHKKDKCYRKKPCTVSGCQGLHHTVLHKHSPEKTEDTTSGQNTSDKGVTVHKDSGTGNEAVTSPQSQGSLPSPGNSTEKTTSDVTSVKTMMSCGGETDDECIISFRIVPVYLSYKGREIRVNAMLDDASSQSYMTERVANHLELNGTPRNLDVEVIGSEHKTVRSMEVSCTLTDDARTCTTIFVAQTIPKVTSCVVPMRMSEVTSKWKHLEGIQFPRPAGRQVELLIGNDYLELKGSMVDVRGKKGEPEARLTPLGWTCIAPVVTKSPYTFLTQTVFPGTTLNDMLHRFWEIEEPKDQKDPKTYTNDEARAMMIAQKTLQYTDKRYSIGIPWVEERPQSHSNNYKNALKSLLALEKRFKKQPLVLKAYNENIKEYLLRDIIEKWVIENPEEFIGWFLTHFPVVRENVETTKVRMVYNGAGKDQGISLNDMILPGPKLQRSQTKILLRFRHRAVAISSDIEKMYLQILLKFVDSLYHLFLWRDGDESKEITIYRFKRVVFGVNASPFLAQFVCRTHALKYQAQYPRAVDFILNSTFVDDGLDSVDTAEEGIQLIKDVKHIYSEASMDIHKWLSNSKEVTASVPLEERASKVDLTKSNLPMTSSLGQGWDAENDKVTFRVPVFKKHPYTKRGYLKVIATIYDPLGLAAPVLITGKILLQELWLTGMEWDDVIPEDLQKKIDSWLVDLESLVEYCLKRCLVPKFDCKVLILVCCDASNDAYGAVAYVWTRDSAGLITTNLAQSKSRVTPIQTINTPRLELMAAVVGVRLASDVADALHVPTQDIYYWADSMDVLYWVRGHSKNFKPFVASRVGEIQLASNPERWQHINGKDNPADLISRGVSSEDMKSSSLWCNGPDFFRQEPEEWPRIKFNKPKNLPETKKNALRTFHASLVQKTVPQNILWKLDALGVNPQKYSSLKKYVKVICYVLRMKNKVLGRVNYKGAIGAEEYEEAFVQIICD